MATLADKKRCDNGKQNIANNAKKVQMQTFKELLENKSYLFLVAEENSKIQGFVMGYIPN